MTTIEVLVRLRAADPWSFTVLDTLARKAGLADVVAVTRLKSWRLDFEGVPAEAAMAATRRLLGETALLANPNRDTWLVRGAAAPSEIARLWTPGTGAASAFAVRVRDREDLAGKSLLRVLRGRLGLEEVSDACFALVWLVELGLGGASARALADSIAVAGSWRRGLLANPHSQAAEVFEAEAYLGGGEAA